MLHISSSSDLQSPPPLGSTRRCRRSCHGHRLSRFKGSDDDDVDDDSDADADDGDGEGDGDGKAHLESMDRYMAKLMELLRTRRKLEILARRWITSVSKSSTPLPGKRF